MDDINYKELCFEYRSLLKAKEAENMELRKTIQKLQNTSSNSDYEAAFRVYCEYDQSNPNRHFDEWLSKRLNLEIPDFT